MQITNDTEVSFLGIGTPRSGTTWFVQCLREHPQIFIPSVKETLFFTRFFYKGIEWYKNHFLEAQPGQILGEFSTEYLYDSNVASLALSLNPKMKFILLLRNPVNRTFSHYLYYKYQKYCKPNFRLALEDHPELIEYSLYYKYIKNFRERCPESPMLILIYEEIIHSPNQAFKKTFNFLGVDENFVPESSDKVINASRTMNYYFPSVNRWYTNSALFRTFINKKTSPLNFLIYKLKKTVILVLTANFKVKMNNTEVIDFQLKQELSILFKNDIVELEVFLDKDLSVWGKAN